MSEKKAIYALSADPITFGHLNIIERAAKLFDELVVAVGFNSHKDYTFPQKERKEMVERAIKNYLKTDNIKAVNFKGLLVDFAYENNIPVIVKGIRNDQDLDYETTFRRLGEAQNLGVDAVLLPASSEFTHISSSGVKMLQREQGMVHKHVPLFIKQKLEANLSKQYVIGISGEAGSGKTYISKKLKSEFEKKGIETHHIELDGIGHEILETRKEDGYRKIREGLVKEFGETIIKKKSGKNLFIDRQKLGEIVFGEKDNLKKLNKIMEKPMLVLLRKKMHEKKGVFILDGALIPEFDWLYLCNNNIILVETTEKEQKERLKNLGLGENEIEKRIKSQASAEKKKGIINKKINKHDQGTLWKVLNTNKTSPNLESLAEEIIKSLEIKN